MSINLLKAHVAAGKLRGNPDFQEFCEGLGDVAVAILHSALQSTPELRVDSTAHARGVMDVWRAIEAARLDLNPRQVKSPPMPAPQEPKVKLNA
jgi:hypothetical protein